MPSEPKTDEELDAALVTAAVAAAEAAVKIATSTPGNGEKVEHLANAARALVEARR